MKYEKFNIIPFRNKCVNIKDPYVAGAEDIVDDKLGKTQELLNAGMNEERNYAPASYSGIGRVVLQKNIKTVNNVEKNYLEQSMMPTATGGNTVYVIKYDYTLAEDITIPNNCVLEFDGGSLTEGEYHLSLSTNTIIIDSLHSFGKTVNRPTIVSVGFPYFDTTLHKHILWNGTKWIESDGATAGVTRKDTSANRPSANDIYMNFIYFDTTLEKPIIWNGIQWVDAVGTIVTVRIQYYLTNVSASNEEQPDAGTQFTTVLTADEGYSLPATIRIDMNSETLTAGTDYTYNQSTGEVVVLGIGGTGGVTGRKLQIVATGVEQE